MLLTVPVYLQNYTKNYASFCNYTHFSKIYRNYASPFYFKFGKNTSIIIQHTSKWQTHLLHLHLEAFKSHDSFSENYENSNTKPAHGRRILGLTELVRYALSFVKKVLWDQEPIKWNLHLH